MSRITPPVPTTTLTPAYSSVSSTAGFQSGDLVYFRDSNFGTIPNNAVTSANFPITANVSQNQTAFNTTVNWANYDPSGSTGSTNSRAPSAALLTNGNIVVVYGLRLGGDGGFRIIDQNGAVVVGRTSIGSNVQGQGIIGVCALSGGGFALAFRNAGTGGMTYGVYSNTGTVVTALTNDSNFGTGFDTVEIEALSGGGFVIATALSSGSFGFRVYSSTGVGGAYTTNSGWANTTAQVVITTFSDNTFAALYPSSSTALQITRFSASGSIVGTTAAASDWFNPAGYEFITLANGTGVMFYGESSANYRIFARTYDQSTGNLSVTTSLIGTIQTVMNARPLAAGGFVMTYAAQSTGQMLMNQYNNSLAAVSTVTIDGLAGYPRNSTASYQQRTTILEGSTFLTLIDNSPSASNVSYNNMPFVQVDKTNITNTGIRRRFLASSVVATQSAAVSGYARSASTPNSASFLAANTQTLTVNIPASSGTTFARTPYTAIPEAVSTQCLTDMANGQFVITYRTSGGAVRFTVFNPDASAVFTTTVVESGAQTLCRSTCLGNGKLVVSWAPNTSTVNFAVYAAGTYALLATGTTSGQLPNTPLSTSSWNNNPGHDIAPFGNDFFVLAYAENSNNLINVAVFNDSAVYQAIAQNSMPGGIQNIRLASDAAGSVAVKFYATSAGSGYIFNYQRGATAGSISTNTGLNLGNYTANNFGEGFAISPYGSTWGFISQGGARRITRGLPGQSPDELSLGSISYQSANVSIGQSGEFVAIRIDDNVQAWYRYGVSPSQNPHGNSVNTQAIASVSITTPGYNTSSSCGSQPQIVNLYDNIYAISYVIGGNSSSGAINVGLICTVASAYSTNITAGVTPSNTALVPSPSNGYYLAGVSASECAAGGTGVLQVNGAATLNSQYPAGTTSQAFDFNTPALDVGVRGTIAGRNLIISGGK
jgi:hypothetical protein